MRSINIITLISVSILILSGCSTIENLRSDDESYADEDRQRTLTQQESRKIDNLFFEAQKQKITGNHDRARDKFREIIDIDPGMDAAHYELAQFYFEQDDLDRSKYHAERAIDADPDNNEWYQQMLAVVLEAQGDYSGAADIYAKLTERFPNRRNNYEDAIELYSEADEYQKALDIVEKLEQRSGYSGAIGFRKFQIYRQLGEIDKAINEVNKLIELHPGDVRFLELLATTYRSEGKMEKAYEVYHRILGNDPHHAPSQFALLNHYTRTNQLEKAEEITSDLFANPEIPIDRKVQVFYDIYLREGFDHSDSVRALNNAEIIADLYPEKAEARALIGDVYYQLDMLEEAKYEYMKALELEKNVLPVWQNVFMINLELRNYEALKAITSDAIEYFPNQADIYYFSGIANRELEQHREAIDDLEMASDLAIDDERFRSEIHTQIADAWYILENMDKMAEHFEKALDLNPDNSVALNNYSYYLALKNKNLEKAREMSARSLELEPENAAYLDTYGWIKYQLGNYEEAEKWIAKALEQEPESKEIVDHYGDVLYKLGNTAEAVKYWEKAYSLSENSSEIKRKIEQEAIINE